MIYLLSNSAEDTTARYFERAAQYEAPGSVSYWDRAFDLSVLAQDDLFVYIDPATDWPLGLEATRGKNLAYFIDVHQDLQARLQCAQFFDAVFVAQRDYVHAFRETGHPASYWLPLACDPEVHASSRGPRIIDVGFVGQLGPPGTRRFNTLLTVLPRFRTNDYTRYYSPQEMGYVYSSSKIVLNCSINGDLNMRFFEALAAGALVITDRIANGLDELFEEDVHFVAYSTPEEAIDKITYYLAHDAARGTISRQGQRLVENGHTYLHRWRELLRVATLAKRQAPARFHSRGTLGDAYSEVLATLRKPSRIPSVMARYGLRRRILTNFGKACGRWLNAKAPMTPNAIRARLDSRAVRATLSNVRNRLRSDMMVHGEGLTVPPTDRETP